MSAETQSQLIVISGPSGSGKDSVVSEVLQRRPAIKRVVTYTSRPPRPGEVNGVDYNFVTRKEFEGMINRNELLEYVNYGEDYKGTSRTDFGQVLNNNQSRLWRIDMSRAATLETDFDSLFDPTSSKSLKSKTVKILIGIRFMYNSYQRMRKRDFNFSAGDFRKRMASDWAVWQTQRDKFPNIIINDTGMLEQTIQSVLQLIDAKRS